MAADESSKMWVPVCCRRVMRYNLFRQADGLSYAILVCATCNKSISLEQESLADVTTFGEGANVLNLLASPKPPRKDRKKASESDGEATLA
jgi:hypothetical protein